MLHLPSSRVLLGPAKPSFTLPALPSLLRTMSRPGSRFGVSCQDPSPPLCPATAVLRDWALILPAPSVHSHLFTPLCLFCLQPTTFMEGSTSIPCPAPPRLASPLCTPLTLPTFNHPRAADYFDGGQHDCQELLRVLMDLLHEDLVSVLVYACSVHAVGSWCGAVLSWHAALEGLVSWHLADLMLGELSRRMLCRARPGSRCLPR